MQTPEPNSAAWLEALYKTDPMLAAHVRALLPDVRALLADVGRSDVCAICGDDHPADYQLCAFRPMTLRLCTAMTTMAVDQSENSSVKSPLKCCA